MMGDLRYRSPRLQGSSLHRVSFYSRSDIFAIGTLEVSNISFTGVGFIRPGHDMGLQKKDVFAGELKIDDVAVNLECEVVHEGSPILGCRILNRSEQLDDVLTRHFMHALDRVKLKKARKEELEWHPHGSPQLYFGDENTQIYFVEDSGRLVEFRVSFFGNLLAGILKDNTRWVPPADIFYLKTDLSPELVTLSEKFVQGANNLDPKWRDAIIDAIREVKY